MIIYIGKSNLPNSYAVSRLVDHLIYILKTACRKNLLQRWKISIEYTSPYTTRVAIQILNPQQIQCFEYSYN